MKNEPNTDDSETDTDNLKIKKLCNYFLEYRKGEKDRYEAFWDIMEFLGYNPELPMPQKDAFFIKAIEERFGKFNTEADIILMVLGLLKGYDYNIEIRITDRRAKYLQESKFLIHDKIPYSKADNKQKAKYRKRLETHEDKLFIKFAAFLNNLKDKEEYLDDIDNYIIDKVANLPVPGYIKRENLPDMVITVIVKCLFLRKKLATWRYEKIIVKNNKCVIPVQLTEGIVLAASILLGAVSLFLMILNAKNYQLLNIQQNYSYVAAEDISKQDYIGTPSDKQLGLDDD